MMPLADLQMALGTLVVKRAGGPGAAGNPGNGIGELNLTLDERQWLAQLAFSSGLAVTCHIQRWWRETRLRWTLRLTLTLLGPEKSAEMIDLYLHAVPPTSLFFNPEALAFLDFALEANLTIRHLRAIATFERALLVAAEARLSVAEDRASVTFPGAVRPWPEAALIQFEARPEELLGAILFGQPTPESSGQPHWVMVDPGLPALWRPVTQDEIGALEKRARQFPIAVAVLGQTNQRQNALQGGVVGETVAKCATTPCREQSCRAQSS
jgi:hypothetical protein